MQYVFDNCPAIGIYEIKEHFLNPYSNSKENIYVIFIFISKMHLFFSGI